MRGTMLMRERAAPGGRRWVSPPGGFRQGAFEGWAILTEVEGADAVLLWQALRDAELWADDGPGGAPGPSGEEWTSAGEPWVTALAGLRRAAGEGREARAAACQGVARAAGAGGCYSTAACFAEVAARILPGHAAPALEAGRAARAAGDPRRAESWIRRAIVLSRRARDRNVYGLACCALGAILRERGDLAGAAERYQAASRMARRYGLWRVRPLACWGLCALAAEAGRTDEATLHGRRALRAFGRRDPRLPLLAHDLARVWCTGGYTGAALRVLRPALERVRGTPQRAEVADTFARAARTPPAADRTPREIDLLSVDLAEALCAAEDGW